MLGGILQTEPFTTAWCSSHYREGVVLPMREVVNTLMRRDVVLVSTIVETKTLFISFKRKDWL